MDTPQATTGSTVRPTFGTPALAQAPGASITLASVAIIAGITVG